ncbi:MAG TPA: hypothetical protein VL282_14185, partial [Tepidisphaeraceae bacterium]|nr:hypothetical protein [Tepidisphaeraceae bacterium]
MANSSQQPTSALSLAALLCAVALAWAQYPARNVGQVNPQVNRAIYSGGPPQSIKYSGYRNSSVAMPSEVRHAYWKSGALPSDIRMGYAALGPMAPGGPLAYIPQAGPSYMPQRSSAPPPAMGASAYNTIRFSAPRVSNTPRFSGSYS